MPSNFICEACGDKQPGPIAAYCNKCRDKAIDGLAQLTGMSKAACVYIPKVEIVKWAIKAGYVWKNMHPKTPSKV